MKYWNAGILGASVNYSVEKSDTVLGKTVHSLIDYLEKLKP